MELTIKTMSDLPLHELSMLVLESEGEGYRFIRRLADEYALGINTFNQKGEMMAAAFQGRMIGFGGLNIDPYLQDPTIGRIRHLYVSPAYRQTGIARRLMELLIKEAKHHFVWLTLRTNNPVAGKFYRRLGFSEEPRFKEATHFLKLT
ncbi:GNAT family N-acetyltransferase [Fictibacillus sp. Mic-4]|uniref:GNAT family N-acetyltransferase n=1 Tax=Fictibacillus TaxID=1329200 RepID=UPI0004139EDE|nr:GNAT family N-acetyltransferase [Fictibacillus gelatini]